MARTQTSKSKRFSPTSTKPVMGRNSGIFSDSGGSQKLDPCVVSSKLKGQLIKAVSVDPKIAKRQTITVKA
jgi:hypothetical protein